MPDAFRLRWKLDRPFLEPGKPEDVHVLLTVEPDPALGFAGQSKLPVHLLLLVDVSGSMDFLVRHDPNAQKIGVEAIGDRAVRAPWTVGEHG